MMLKLIQKNSSNLMENLIQYHEVLLVQPKVHNDFMLQSKDTCFSVGMA